MREAADKREIVTEMQMTRKLTRLEFIWIDTPSDRHDKPSARDGSRVCSPGPGCSGDNDEWDVTIIDTMPASDGSPLSG